MPDQKNDTTKLGSLVIHGSQATLFGPIPNPPVKAHRDVSARFGNERD